MDLSVFENPREKNHREEALELASAHWQPVQDSFLVVKIALGVSGGEEGVEEERKTGFLVPLGSSHHSQCCWCTGEGRQALEGPLGCFCFVTLCVGGGRGGLTLLAIKSFLCHKDPSQWPGCGAAG